MNKFLVQIFLPVLGESYEIWIPMSETIYQIILLLLKGINYLDDQDNLANKTPVLYNKHTGANYDLNLKVKDTDIKNGTELILMLV